MNTAKLDQIVEAVLYEGYILYPYRASSKKNQRERFTFGRVYPDTCAQVRAGEETSHIRTECLVEVPVGVCNIRVSVRFLHLLAREVGLLEEPSRNHTDEQPRWRIVPEVRIGDELFQTWHEAVERRVDLSAVELKAGPTSQQYAFRFPEQLQREPILDQGTPVGLIQRRQAEIIGLVEIIGQPLKAGLFKIAVQVVNRTVVSEQETGSSEGLLLRTFASTHTILHAEGGCLISLMDPPEKYREAAEQCANEGTWPVLVGDEEKHERHTMLSSPIILYDYPKVAPESAGPLFDGTEIDEILTLRILTLTDEEKSDMRRVDQQARQLLERTESISESSLLGLHGVLRQGPDTRTVESMGAPTASLDGGNQESPREDVSANVACEGSPSMPCSKVVEFDDFFGANTRLEGVSFQGAYVRAGTRVRISPKARADVMDLALRGKTAIVEAVEQDAEHRVHLALVLEEDPGKDLGWLRQPGHRFFYGLDEVELLEAAS